MHRPIRVAFWHNVFAPYRVPVFQRLARYDDIDLTVLYGSAKDSHRAWNVDFGSGYQYTLLPHITIPGYPYKYNPTLTKKLVRRPYDVYIAVENEIGAMLTYRAARRVHKPFLLWSIEIDYNIVRDRRDYTLRAVVRKALPFLGRHLRGWLFAPLRAGVAQAKRQATAYLAAGEQTERHLRNFGAQGPIFRFGNAIDSARLRQRLQEAHAPSMRQTLGIEGKLVILSVSYLQERKGVQYLIDAVLAMNRPDIALVIVGDGEYRHQLTERVPDDCQAIIFVGHADPTAPYYAMADMFAMPSFSDPWGLTINEAMVAGLPVVTTSNVGAQELIQGNGFVVPPRDSAALQTALERLLDDADLRERMGRRSQEIIAAYTIEHTAAVCRQAIRAVAGRLE